MAVGMITCEMFKGQGSWSWGVGPSDGWLFYRPIVGGGWFEKKKVAIGRARRALGFFCNQSDILRSKRLSVKH